MFADKITTYFNVRSVPLAVFPAESNGGEETVRMIKLASLQGQEHGRERLLET